VSNYFRFELAHGCNNVWGLWLDGTGRDLRLIVLIVGGVFFREHALMQDAGNQNAASFLPIEQNMFAMLMTAQADANFITDAA